MKILFFGQIVARFLFLIFCTSFGHVLRAQVAGDVSVANLSVPAPMPLAPDLELQLQANNSCMGSGKSDIVRQLIINIAYSKQLGDFILGLESQLQNKAALIGYISGQIGDSQAELSSAGSNYAKLKGSLADMQKTIQSLVAQLPTQLSAALTINTGTMVRDDACRATLAPAMISTLVPLSVGVAQTPLAQRLDQLKMDQIASSIVQCEKSVGTASVPTTLGDQMNDAFVRGMAALISPDNQNMATPPNASLVSAWRQPDATQTPAAQARLESVLSTVQSVNQDFSLISSNVMSVQGAIAQLIDNGTAEAAQVIDTAVQIRDVQNRLMIYADRVKALGSDIAAIQNLIMQAGQQLQNIKSNIDATVSAGVVKECASWLQMAIARV